MQWSKRWLSKSKTHTLRLIQNNSCILVGNSKQELQAWRIFFLHWTLPFRFFQPVEADLVLQNHLWLSRASTTVKLIQHANVLIFRRFNFISISLQSSSKPRHNCKVHANSWKPPIKIIAARTSKQLTQKAIRVRFRKPVSVNSMEALRVHEPSFFF